MRMKCMSATMGLRHEDPGQNAQDCVPLHDSPLSSPPPGPY